MPTRASFPTVETLAKVARTALLDPSPEAQRRWLAGGALAALTLLAVFVDVVQDGVARGDRLRAAQQAHRAALATHHPRQAPPLPAHLLHAADGQTQRLAALEGSR